MKEELTLQNRLKELLRVQPCAELEAWLKKPKGWDQFKQAIRSLLTQAQDPVACLCLIDSGGLLENIVNDWDPNDNFKSIMLQYTDRFNTSLSMKLQGKTVDEETYFRVKDTQPYLDLQRSDESQLLKNWRNQPTLELTGQVENQIRIADRFECQKKREYYDQVYGEIEMDYFDIPTKQDENDKLVNTNYLKAQLKQANQILEQDLNANLCVIGPECSGKMSFVNLLKNKEAIVITLEESFDSKNLVGTYVCDETGSFVFKKGPLTVAAEKGLWLIVRNVDKAPPDLLTFLLPLVQEGFLQVSADMVIRPKFGFRIITLCESIQQGIEPLIAQMGQVELDSMQTREDFPQILQNLFQKVHQIDWLPKALLETVQLLEQTMRKLRGTLLDIAPFSVRHVLKLFNRVDQHLPNGQQFLGTNQVSQIIVNIFEVYLAHMYSKVYQQRVLAEVITEFNRQLQNADLAAVDSQSLQDFIFDLNREYQVTDQQFYFGRCQPFSRKKVNQDGNYVYTASTLRLLEQITMTIQIDEPALLVGETGTGKTSCVQEIARLSGKKLSVFNMNQNTDCADLLGGFKPVDLKFILRPSYTLFLELFKSLFKSSKNSDYLSLIDKCYQQNQAKEYIQCLTHGLQSIKTKSHDNQVKKLEAMAADLQKRVKKLEQGFIFQFIEGTLIESIQNGDWVLLDEINLASDTVLNKLATIVSGEHILLNERADVIETERHPDFRLFMCMNPPYTSAGKKQLPASLRQKLTELYVPELTQEADLWPIIDRNAPANMFKEEQRRGILHFYVWVRQEVQKHNRKSNIGLRNLVRSMCMMRQAITQKYPVQKAIYDSLMTCFTSHLQASLQEIISQNIFKIFDIKQLPLLNVKENKNQVKVGEFLINHGGHKVNVDEGSFILTPSFKHLVSRLASIVSVSDYAVILEGPTSAGKTSTVKYLAEITGNKIIRINNHMHTDIQEYIGSYNPSPETGKLVFQEGVLVEAVRQGYWVILDELNLAPSEVLEALNRLLDDNRELHIVETQKTIKAHPNFRLFATQNPTEGYGGRKELSEAFKNRFILIKVGEVPSAELQQILVERQGIPASRATLMIKTMEQLQIYRSKASLFSGKDSLITVRDLLKWADRLKKADENGGGLSPQQIALEAFLLLGERARSTQDKDFIKETIEKCLKVKINVQQYYQEYFQEKQMDKLLPLVHTNGLKRLAVLLFKCLENREPVLLVGETGTGKTSLCQVFAKLFGQDLFAINCHQNTETSDFIGCMRTRKDLEGAQKELQEMLEQHGIEVTNIKKQSKELMKKLKTDQNPKYKELKKLINKTEQIFEWHDGILVESMTKGGLLLIDEISLANDSVLERLNSVFERDRILTLSEKSSTEAINIKADQMFNIVATMNPSGDFGKKELSPALRNRMTEIWVDSYFQGLKFDGIQTQDVDVDLFTIIKAMSPDHKVALTLFNFMIVAIPVNLRATFSVRDIITMVQFLEKQNQIGSNELKHAAEMVLLDSIKINTFDSQRAMMARQFQVIVDNILKQIYGTIQITESLDYFEDEKQVKVGSFGIDRKSQGHCSFSFEAPTTLENLHRLLRAFTLNRPILMEGPPGVGKTSIVENLAKKTGRLLSRVNLSEQTDMMDLLGAEYPVQEGEDVRFKWCDGILLTAIKEGHWFLIDEMNLAQQSVLEGLNAILDHRRVVYIPELGKEFQCHPDFFVFACQNPSAQASGSVGGRKSLPKSFLNRFNKIYLEDLSEVDYKMILGEQLKGTQLTVEEILKPGLNLRDFSRFLRIYKHLDEDFIAAEAVCQQSDIKMIQARVDKQQIKLQTNHFSVNLNHSQINLQSLLEIQTAQLSTLALCLQVNMPILVITDDPHHAVKQIQTLAQLNHKNSARILLNSRSDTTQLLGCYEQTDKSQFVWVDSLLLKAMLNGDWVLIENANLANAAVLDRLNGLLEDDGQLIVNEQGVIFEDGVGKLRKLVPKEGFRTIFIVEKKSLDMSDVSRALRNRCFTLNLTDQKVKYDQLIQEQISDRRNMLHPYHGQLRFDLRAFTQQYQQVDQQIVLGKRQKSDDGKRQLEIREFSLEMAYQLLFYLQHSEVNNSDLKIVSKYLKEQYDINNVLDQFNSTETLQNTLLVQNNEMIKDLSVYFEEKGHLMETQLQKIVEQIQKQGQSFDQLKLYGLLKQIKDKQQLSKFAQFFYQNLLETQNLVLPEVQRIFSLEHLEKYHDEMERRVQIKELPYDQLICIDIQSNTQIQFMDNFDVKLLNYDKEFVEILDPAQIYEALNANSPYLIMSPKQKMQLCVTNCILSDSLIQFNDLFRILGKHRYPFPSQIPPIDHDIVKKLALVNFGSDQPLNLIDSILGSKYDSTLKYQPAFYFCGNALLSLLKQLPTDHLPGADESLSELAQEVLCLVKSLEMLPFEVQKIKQEHQLRIDVELQGLINYQRYHLKGVCCLPQLETAQQKIKELQKDLIKSQNFMPLDDNPQHLTGLIGQVEGLVEAILKIEKFRPFQKQKKLWPEVEKLQSIVDSLINSELFIHFGHIHYNLIDKAFNLLIALRKIFTSEPQCSLSSLHKSIEAEFDLSQDNLQKQDQNNLEGHMLSLLQWQADIKNETKVQILDYFIQRDVAERIKMEMGQDDEQIMQLPFKISMQQAIIEETKAIDELTKKDKEEKEKLEKEEIEIVFPSYFNELQKAMVLQEEGDKPMKEQRTWWKLEKIGTDEIMNELIGFPGKNEAVYRSEALRHRLQCVASEHQTKMKIGKLQIERHLVESFYEQDKNTWLKDTINVLEDQLYQAQISAVMNISDIQLPHSYNFYHDSLPQEARLFYQPLAGLQDRVLNILKDYQSPILNDLVFLTNYMLTQFNTETPLMKLLTGMDIVLQKLDEWDTYSSKNLNSCEEQTNEIKQLIIRYRKIQILSWRNLLAYKKLSMTKKDYQSSVRLIHSIERQIFDENMYKRASQSSKAMKTVELEVFSVVDLFIRDSQLGQFEARLEAVKLLMKSVQSKAASAKSQIKERADKVLNIMSFVLGYYGQFRQKLIRTIDRLDAQSREKIKTLIDISKWSLQKFSQVKSNIDKTHRQLNKAVKGEEEILMQNIQTLVLNSSRKKYVGAGEGDKLISLDNEKQELFNKLPGTLEVKTYQDQTLKQFEFFTKQHIQNHLPDHTQLEQFMEGMFERLKTVRDLDQKHIQRRALIDLIKFMREQGLTINFQDKLQPHLIECSLIEQDDQQLQARLEKYYYKAHELLIMLEASSQTDENSDIKNQDIIRMQGMSQSLMQNILLLNQKIYKLQQVQKSFKTQHEFTEGQTIQAVTERQQIKENMSLVYNSLNQRMDMLKKLDNQSHIYVNNMDDLRSLDTDVRQKELISIFNIKIDQLQQALNQIELLDTCAETRIDTEYFIKLIKILYQDIKQVLKEYGQKQDCSTLEDEEEEDMSVEDWNIFAQKLLDSLQNSPKIIEFVNKAFSKNNLLTPQIMSSLNLIRDLMNQMFDTLNYMVDSLVHYLASLCKFSYISQRVFIYLIYQGFCGKQEEQQDQEQDQLFEGEGCGMGDGQGEADKNVSNEIEHEEQLEGLKDYESDEQQQQEENKDKPENEEGDDNEFEMKEDFDGDMEDDEKKDQEEDKKSEEEPDDEQDQVDDQLDNQLWDKNMDDMQQKEDENNEEENEDKRSLDLGERELEDQNKTGKDEEMVAGDHDEQKSQEDQQEKNDDQKSQGDSQQEDKEEDENPDEVPLDRPELIEEEEVSKESEEAGDIDMDQLDSAGESQGDEEENKDGLDQEEDQDIEGDKNSEISDVMPSDDDEQGSQIGGDDNQNQEDPELQQQKSKAQTLNQQENEKAQQQEDGDNDGENQEFDVGNDILFEMAQQIQQQAKEQEQKQAKEEMEKVQQPNMVEQQQEEYEKRDQHNAYELDNDEAEQMEGNLAADQVEKQAIQEDDAEPDGENMEMNDESEQDQQENKQRTEKELKNLKEMEKNKAQKNELNEEIDEEMVDENQQNETNLAQDYDDYLQQKVKQDDIEIDRVEMEYEPVQNSIGDDYDYNIAKVIMGQTFQTWLENQDGQTMELLQKFRQETSEASAQLCEQLRIVLEPQLSQQLEGDFKTGKRLHMKKVISFIASHYRNDKIWLRRTMPSKRDYKILLAIDDSLSMSEQNCGFFSLEAMVTLVEALNRLEVGKVAVTRISDRLNLLQSFECQHSSERLAYNLSSFKFDFCQKDSHDFAMANFMRDCNKILDIQNTSTQGTSCPFVIILSDGRFNKQNVMKYLSEAQEKRYLYIFVILDPPKDGKTDKSIMNLRSTVKEQGKIKLIPYLKDFPYQYYCIVRDLHQLPESLGSILVQWFSLFK